MSDNLNETERMALRVNPIRRGRIGDWSQFGRKNFNNTTRLQSHQLDRLSVARLLRCSTEIIWRDRQTIRLELGSIFTTTCPCWAVFKKQIHRSIVTQLNRIRISHQSLCRSRSVQWLSPCRFLSFSVSLAPITPSNSFSFFCLASHPTIKLCAHTIKPFMWIVDFNCLSLFIIIIHSNTRSAFLSAVRNPFCCSKPTLRISFSFVTCLFSNEKAEMKRRKKILWLCLYFVSLALVGW